MAADPGDDLVERTTLQARLREWLYTGDVALHGPGGIGKSTLARQVTRELRDRFPGGVLWASIGQEATGPALAAVIADLILHLTGEPPGVVTPAQAGERLAAELAFRPPILLVVDDVWTPEQLAPFLDAGCRRLIITRVGGVLPVDLPRIDVGEMTHDDATALLTRDLPGLSLPDLGALLALTGRWPLLIAIANGMLRQGLSAHQLIDQLGAGGWVALDLTVPGERDRAVDGFVGAALDLLPETDRRRFLELGIFPEHGPIPDPVSDSLWSGTGGLSPLETDHLRTALSRLSLVRRTSEGLWMHDVLRAYLRNRLPDPEIAQVNRRLVEMSRPRSGGPWWTLPEADRYLWRHLGFHLREARWWDELFAAVTDLRRLAVQIPLLGVATAVADLARMPDPRAVALRARLSRSAHLLHPIRPAEALTDVLLARLAGAPEIAADVAALITAQRSRAGLIARWPLPDVGPDSLTRVIAGDAGWLDGVVISPNGDWIATAGDAGVITLHDWVDGAVTARITGHQGAVKALAVTFDGGYLVSGGSDGTLRAWEVARRQERVLWTANGEILGLAAAPGNHRIAAVSSTGELIVLDAAGNWRILGHQAGEKLVGCAFLDDDRVLTVSEEGAVAGHELRSGRRKALVAAGRAGVIGFAITPLWAAIGGIDGEIRVHPLREAGAVVTLGGHRGCLGAIVAFGDRIISGGEDGTVRVFDRYGGEVAVVRAHPSWVTGCAIGPDRRTLVTTGSDGSTRVWDLPRLVQETVGGPVDWVNTCSVQPSGASPVHSSGAALVSGGQDGVVRLWEGSASRPIWSWDEPVLRCAFGPDGTWLVAVCSNGTALLRNVGDAWADTMHAGAVDCAVTTDLFARWDARGELEIRSVTGPDVYRRAHEHPIRAAAFLPRDRMIIADAGGALVVWHYTKDRTRPVAHAASGEIRAIHQVADQVAVISGSGLELFDVRGLRPAAVASFPASASTSSSFSLGAATHGAISSDGEWLATTSSAGELRVWPLAGLGEDPEWQPVAAMRVDGELFECAWLPDSLDLHAAGRRGMYAFTFRPPRPLG
ncbi:NB-ARC domain-containing protein [Actinoplanes sp. L3-i22]|uniref:NB-ARC domain-containing protein n=1 Tax=Actinoplanes sp. L3-i22 TaxID=2836373 RepID=UPI001C864091|nr:NB-ARC domain-containing protein [Actinoplanes sp. L3-i22]